MTNDVVPLAGDLPDDFVLPMQPLDVLDRLADRAASALDTPVGLVSLVATDGQYFPGAIGLPEPWITERWTPLTHSFCQHVVTSGEPLVVSNAHDDPLVRTNPAVTELGVIAYVGSPLTDATGRVVGALCAIDHKPRLWTEHQVSELGRLAVEASDEIAARALNGHRPVG